ncbi:Voltage-dependent calcium channel [Trichinella pseudospiralis]
MREQSKRAIETLKQTKRTVVSEKTSRLTKFLYIANVLFLYLFATDSFNCVYLQPTRDWIMILQTSVNFCLQISSSVFQHLSL